MRMASITVSFIANPAGRVLTSAVFATPTNCTYNFYQIAQFSP